MPTFPATADSFRGERGFTLVEAMVAIMIVALLASAVTLMATNDSRAVRQAADQVAARLAAAADESVISNRPIGVVVTEQGYGFERRSEARWLEMDGVFAFRPWPKNLSASIEGRDAKSPDAEPAPAAAFDPLGGATPVRITLSRHGAAWTVAIDEAGRIHVSQS